MKKTIPAVSIVIPMYNAEKYIGECLDSILAQTFTDYEVIVVDDCSTDNSRAVVQSYLHKFNGGGNLISFVAKLIQVTPHFQPMKALNFHAVNIFSFLIMMICLR